MDLHGDHDNVNPHLTVSLPEILARITTFLPKSDLLSCTWINTTWEHEIRKRLLPLSRLFLTPQDLTQAHNIITTRGNCPHTFRLHKFEYIAQIREIICGHKVKILKTDFVLPNSSWSEHLESLAKTFPNLTTLKLCVSLWPWDENSVDESELPPKTGTFFVKVKTLQISSYGVLEDEDIAQIETIFRTITPQFMPLFPNLNSLSFLGSSQPVMETLLEFTPTLTSLTLINTGIEVPIKPTFSHLTCLELGDETVTYSSGFSNLLKITAGTLEKVKFSEIHNITPFEVFCNFVYDAIDFPIMPKLRVFEFAQNQCTDRDEYKNSVVMPRIGFRFEGGDPTKILNYEVQFPVLETIRISKAKPEMIDDTENILTEREYFETSVSFLYRFFLHESNWQGLTLKRLDVPFPPGDRFRVVTETDCECGRGDYGSCECFEWRDSSEFWDRVAAIFPNLGRYQGIGGI
ncbi:uncharacterized protein LOC118437458 [Folsomia candida]|uniref:F-box domain-containing protein n=1 Tax=Folsomia candida TaxID=158441 RepID=A0A226DPV9_FOLCA|nr:uncharacterized protein LOC118437458 [Folsomia candida]OXA47545.1 hypothetical protein Fcan01_17981 [Folsomia candida]